MVDICPLHGARLTFNPLHDNYYYITTTNCKGSVITPGYFREIMKIWCLSWYASNGLKCNNNKIISLLSYSGNDDTICVKLRN